MGRRARRTDLARVAGVPKNLREAIGLLFGLWLAISLLTPLGRAAWHGPADAPPDAAGSASPRY